MTKVFLILLLGFVAPSVSLARTASPDSQTPVKSVEKSLAYGTWTHTEGSWPDMVEIVMTISKSATYVKVNYMLAGSTCAVSVSSPSRVGERRIAFLSSARAVGRSWGGMKCDIKLTAMTVDYFASGNQLTLTNAKGMSGVYQRQN